MMQSPDGMKSHRFNSKEEFIDVQTNKKITVHSDPTINTIYINSKNILSTLNESSFFQLFPGGIGFNFGAVLESELTIDIEIAKELIKQLNNAITKIEDFNNAVKKDLVD